MQEAEEEEAAAAREKGSRESVALEQMLLVVRAPDSDSGSQTRSVAVGVHAVGLESWDCISSSESEEPTRSQTDSSLTAAQLDSMHTEGERKLCDK